MLWRDALLVGGESEVDTIVPDEICRNIGLAKYVLFGALLLIIWEILFATLCCKKNSIEIKLVCVEEKILEI